MRVLDRGEAEAVRQALRLSPRSDFAEYRFRVLIHLPELGSLRNVLDGLVQARPTWWLVPIDGYFGDTWSREQWSEVGLPPLMNDVVEWSAADLAAMERILTPHYWDGCCFYLASTDSRLLAPAPYGEVSGGAGDEFNVAVASLGAAEVLSAHLRAAGVPNDVQAKRPDA